MCAQWRLRLFWLIMILLALPIAACSNIQARSAQSPLHAVATAPSVDADRTSATSFSFSGTPLASYTIHTNSTISKLRHGHQEFTINLVDTNKSLIIAFIGYTGPAIYTLSNRLNGGDVRIAIDQQYWDLSLLTTASCSLAILSDTPTDHPELHRMKGAFSCPELPAGYFNKTFHPVTITDGKFDVLIIVES